MRGIILITCMAIILYGCEGQLNAIQINGAIESKTPAAPLLTFAAGSYSPSLNRVPKLKIDGVVGGSEVKIFTNSDCTNEIASANALSTSVEITLPTQTPGQHDYYSKYIVAGKSSLCSPVLSYDLGNCPPEYVAVPKNENVDANADFCAMKYEAKNVGGVATSEAPNTPWINIHQVDAIAACDALNGINSVVNKYALISNEEWMALARNIEATTGNWDTGIVGSGHMNRGWSRGFFGEGDMNTWFASVSDSTCLFNHAVDNCAPAGPFHLKRTNILSNAEEIWDIGSNVIEVTSTTFNRVTDKPYSSGDGALVNDFRTLISIDTLVGTSDVFALKRWAPLGHPAYDSTYNVGEVYLGDTTVGGAIVRGGFYNGGIRSGVFAMDLSIGPTDTWFGMGFRCVYRP